MLVVEDLVDSSGTNDAHCWADEKRKVAFLSPNRAPPNLNQKIFAQNVVGIISHFDGRGLQAGHCISPSPFRRRRKWLQCKVKLC